MDKTINEVADQVGENFEQVKSQITERAGELQSTLSTFVDESPLRAVGIAFGVGYLLSGALFSRTTMRMASVGGRFVLGGFLKQILAGVGPGLIATLTAAAGEPEQSQPKTKRSPARPTT